MKYKLWFSWFCECIKNTRMLISVAKQAPSAQKLGLRSIIGSLVA